MGKGQVGLRELKGNLARYVRRAAAASPLRALCRQATPSMKNSPPWWPPVSWSGTEKSSLSESRLPSSGAASLFLTW